MAFSDQNSLPPTMMGTGTEGGPAQPPKFSQTLQTHAAMAASADGTELLDLERQVPAAERARWVLDAPEPPGLWHELVGSLREIALPHGKRSRSSRCAGSVLKGMFPVLKWIRKYKLAQFKNDLMAGLTLASLCIPQVCYYLASPDIYNKSRLVKCFVQ